MDDSFPCGFCTVDINDGDKALQCEGSCTQWFHCRCIFGFELTLAHNIKHYHCLKRNGGVQTAMEITPH